MHLDLFDDIHAVLAVDHVNSKSSPAKATCAANPVKVRLIIGVTLHVHWEVKVHHQRHLFHIDPCDQQNHQWFNNELQTQRPVNACCSHLWSTHWWSPAPSPCRFCSAQ